MSNFWSTSDNEKIKAGGEFESGGGNLEPIPANTSVLAACDEAKWASYDGDHYVSLRWVVLQPADYKGRKVFQKLRVLDNDAKKADKAKRMLAAIDTNAGGHLLESSAEPSDEALTKHLTNKPMVLKIQVWEIEGDDGQKKSGNWVSAVSPKSGGVPAASAAAKPAPAPKPSTAFDDGLPGF